MVRRSLTIKLLRDLKNTSAQVFAIALVIAAGTATYIMSMSTLDSLHSTRQSYYADYRFADIFANAKRVPQGVAERLQEISGVAYVETRVVASAKLDIPEFSDPVKGLILSLPNAGQPALNQLYLRRGRMVDTLKDDEVVVNEAFAEAHALQAGDHFAAVINGHLKKLTVVGIALSPEFIYQIAPGAIMPDFKRYGVLWMARRHLESAYDMDGAFNNVVLSITTNAVVENVIDKVDYILAPYGGIDAHDRYWQLSHRFLSEEFKQLQQMASLFATIFLGVAAFLLNVLITRLVATQREQIAALKAFGYSNAQVAWHYLSYVLMIVSLGLLIGILSGIWLGKGLSNMYMDYYRFPFMSYRLHWDNIAFVTAVSSLAAIAGTLVAVWRAVRLSPAEAMQAEPPAKYRLSLIEKLGLSRLPPITSMILRHIERKPLKSGLAVLGIAMACSIMVLGTFFQDSMNKMLDVEYGLAQRQDATVSFVEPTSKQAFFELLNMPEVEYVEGFRSVAARLRHNQREYKTAIMGYENQRSLNRTLDITLQPVELPPAGLVLSQQLAKVLMVKPGDLIQIDVLEGRRQTLTLPIVSLVNQYIGLGAYMNIDALNTLLLESHVISGAHLALMPGEEEAVYQKLKVMPHILNIDIRSNIINSFKETFVDFILIYIAFLSILAGTIAFGVVYNCARIALAERNRELASMRVLGFTHGEISYILLGELGLLTLLAIPLGLVIGYGLSAYIIANFQYELFQIPFVISTRTYTLAALVVLIAAGFSGFLVRQKLHKLDMIAVLKTKE